LDQRAVAVVVDPIQSVKGKVVIDAFRLINPQLMLMGQEPRQTTSNLGQLNKPSIQGRIHGLNRHYYSMGINYRKNELEQKMLLNLHKSSWTSGLTMEKFEERAQTNADTVRELRELSLRYQKAIQEENELSKDELVVARVGKIDAKARLSSNVEKLMSDNIVQSLAAMIDTVVF
jgi:26S proteasome regulatory subunit N11